MKLTPLADRVVLKTMEAEETTKGGIIKPGDKVITDKYAGSNVKIGEDEYVIVRQGDILAIVE